MKYIIFNFVLFIFLSPLNAWALISDDINVSLTVLPGDFSVFMEDNAEEKDGKIYFNDIVIENYLEGAWVLDFNVEGTQDNELILNIPSQKNLFFVHGGSEDIHLAEDAIFDGLCPLEVLSASSDSSFNYFILNNLYIEGQGDFEGIDFEITVR